MKKTSPLLILLLIIGMKAISQQYYVRTGLGLNAPFNSSLLARNTISTVSIPNNNINSYQKEIQEEGVYGSYGKGVTFNACFGYKLTPRIAIEFQISKSNGASYNYSFNSTYIDSATQRNVKGTGSVSGDAMMYIPSIHVSTELKKVEIYSRLGIVFSSGSLTFDEDFTDTYNGQRYNVLYEKEYKGELAIGGMAAAGCAFSLQNGVTFYSEITMISLYEIFDQGNVTRLNVNGQSFLSAQSPSYRYVNLSRSYNSSYNWNGPLAQNRPSTGLIEPDNFSSIGLSMGIKINF